MNDFTKEELELIAESLESDFYRSNWPRSMYEPLMNKLQSMIDSYCEHPESSLIERLENYLINIKEPFNTIIDHNDKEHDVNWISGYLTAIEKIERFLIRND